MDRGLVRSPAAVTGRYSQTNAKNTPNVLWNASRASLERSTMNVLRIKSGLNVVSAKDFMCVCVCVCVCVCGCLAVFFFFLEGGSLKSADQTCSYSLFSFGKFLKKETVTVISPNSAAHHLPLPPERWERLVEAERKREREKKKKRKTAGQVWLKQQQRSRPAVLQIFIHPVLLSLLSASTWTFALVTATRPLI